MIVGLSAIIVSAAIWALVVLLRAARVFGLHRAGGLVAFAANRLSHDYPEWGQAMLAEFEHVDGRVGRWQFAIGCAWVALLPPRQPEVTGSLTRALMSSVVIATGGIGLYGLTRTADRSLDPDPLAPAVFVAILSGYLAITLVLSLANSPSAVVARRYGLPGGLIIGGLLLTGNTPASPVGNLSMDANMVLGGIGSLLPLGAALGVAFGAARAGRTTRAGIEGALLAGLLGSMIFCLGLLSLSYLATTWFTGDPLTIASLQYVSSDTSQDIVTFVLRSNAETAWILILTGPVVSTLLGAVGGLVGAHHARGI